VTMVASMSSNGSSWILPMVLCTGKYIRVIFIKNVAGTYNSLNKYSFHVLFQ
jgi:hypothetical protein